MVVEAEHWHRRYDVGWDVWDWSGWAIPFGVHTLEIALGGIAQKPGIVDGRIEICDYLCLTMSVDHDIIDGAPAARFVQRLKELIEGGYGLCERASCTETDAGDEHQVF